MNRIEPIRRRNGLRMPRFVLLLSGILAVGAALILFFFDPTTTGIYPLCPLHRVTGLACPGCGSLRAIHHLLHGQMAGALHCNALLVAGMPVAVGFGIWSLFRRRHLILSPVWSWAALALILTFGIVRNLPFPAAAWLRP